MQMYLNNFFSVLQTFLSFECLNQQTVKPACFHQFDEYTDMFCLKSRFQHLKTFFFPMFYLPFHLLLQQSKIH